MKPLSPKHTRKCAPNCVLVVVEMVSPNIEDPIMAPAGK